MKHDKEIKAAYQGADYPSPAEVKAALIHQICDEEEAGVQFPVTIRRTIDAAIARANAGEFR